MKKLTPILIALLICLITTGHAFSQSEDVLHLSLSRDFGYGGIGNDIQGLFSLKVTDPPPDLLAVDFMIDGQSVFHDTESPFVFQFTTDGYPLGAHTLSAVGQTSAGLALTSNSIVVDFVPADEGMKAAGKFIAPVFALIAVAMLATLIPVFISRRKGHTLPLGAPRNFGVTGGTICPKCKRPFAMHFLALNMVVGKLDICPHCGKISIVRRYPREVLDTAIAAEAQMGTAAPLPSTQSAEEKLRKDLEDSKYHDI